MSRFLEHGGVYLADAGAKRAPPSSSSSSSSAINPSAAGAGQWVQLAGKWVKLGPSGKPRACTPSSLAQAAPASDQLQQGESSSAVSRTTANASGATAVEGGPGSPLSSPSPELLLSPSSSSAANGPSAEGRGGGGGGGGGGSLPLSSSGVTPAEGFSRDAKLQQHASSGSWDPMTGEPTVSITNDNKEYAKRNGSEEARRDVHARLPPLGGGGGSSSGTPRGNVLGEGDGEGVAGGSGGSRGLGGNSSSGGATVLAAGLAGEEDGLFGSANSKESTIINRSVHINTTTSAAGGGSSSLSRELMLTPGISRTYSKDEIVGKFFGNDGGPSPTAAAAAAAAAALGAAGGAATSQRGEKSSGVNSNQYDSASSAACVGERSGKDATAGGRGSQGGGGAGSNGRGSGSGIGAKNIEGLAAEDELVTPAVETHDVACQWDGSEMGESSDEEDAFPLAELPDTPDCNALTAVLRLYDHARAENRRTGVLASRPGWGLEPNIENWDGVYLDTEDRVVALDVDGDPENRQAVLIGPLPVELSEMDHLEQLTMRRHRFKGRIPGELGKLTRLTHLNLSNCRLIGFIPPEFGDLLNLVVLNLSWNFLSGELPPELGKLSNLEELLVNSNAFSGAIPPELGKMRKLKKLNAGHNIGLSGTLPPEMCRMTSLALLDLRHNKISGKIPPLFGRLTNLQQLFLQDNQLTDDIPAELARLPKLQMLHLANNKLSGSIPMALRGHPRYRSFKVLPGNFALGERVAPNEKQIEAAAHRQPSKGAMAHASGALAESKAQQRQLRSDSLSQSPPFPNANGDASRRRTTGGVAATTAANASAGTANPSGFDPGTELSTEDFKRRGSGGGGRASMGRRLRDMKRIMGKKPTPPASPTLGGNLQGDGTSYETSSANSTSPNPGGVGSVSRGHSFSPHRRELTVVEGNDETDSMRIVHQGKAFLEASEGGDDGGAGTGGDDDEDGSPNPTASLSTGNGASSSSSSNASPSSQDGVQELAGGSGGGGSGGENNDDGGGNG